MQGSKAMANIQLDNQNTILVGGFNPSEKKKKTDDYAQYMERKHLPNHQSVSILT